jgi:hypothetical protein
MNLRIEILKFLSDSHNPKPLNQFLKTNMGDITLIDLSFMLEDMSLNPTYNVIRLEGDWMILGKKFIESKTEFDKSIDKVFGIYNSLRNESSDENNPNLVLGTLDNIPLRARINARGKKELEEVELRNSIEQVNQSVVKTNKVTLVIAGLAALFSFMSIIAPLLKSDKLSVPQIQETNKILQKQVQVLDSLQRNLQRFDSLPSKRK